MPKMKSNFRGLVTLLAKDLNPEPDVFVRELIQKAHDSTQLRRVQIPDHAGQIQVAMNPANPIAPRGGRAVSRILSSKDPVIVRNCHPAQADTKPRMSGAGFTKVGDVSHATKKAAFRLLCWSPFI